MSKLASLIGKSQTFTIGDLQIEIKPRTLKDMDLIIELADDSKKSKALIKLIHDTLLEAIPDATEEEISSVGIQYFKELSEAIVQVNGLSTPNVVNK